MVFFSLVKMIYVRYSFQLANAMHIVLFLLIVALVGTHSNSWRAHLKSAASVNVSFIGAIFGANVVAFVMSKLLDRSLSWFRVEFSCLLLYAPAALAGTCLKPYAANGTSQLELGALFFYLLFPVVSSERLLFKSILLTHSFLACVIQFAGIGSAVVFFLSASSLFVALTIERFVTGHPRNVWLGAYVIGHSLPAVLGAEIFFAVSDIFVPLVRILRFPEECRQY